MSDDGIMKIENPKHKEHFAHIREVEKHVRVRLQDTILADSESPLALTENGKFLYDTVYYIPKEDVRVRMVKNKDKNTQCPIKGEASYWHWDEIENIAWSYDDPLEQSSILKDYVGFDLRKVDLLILAQ